MNKHIGKKGHLFLLHTCFPSTINGKVLTLQWKTPLWARISMASNETDGHSVPHDTMDRRGHDVTSVVFLPKMQNLNLIIRQQQTDQIQGEFTE